MAQIHELNITNFVDTGQTTPIARYTFTLELKYTNDGGTLTTHGPQSYTYPNALSPMPLAVRKRFAIDMITAVAKVAVGAATWSEYE